MHIEQIVGYNKHVTMDFRSGGGVLITQEYGVG